VNFEHVWLLAVAPLFAAGIAMLATVARARRERAAAAWSRALGELARSFGRRSPWMLGAAAFVAAIGLSGPRWGAAAVTAESRALNIIMVMDVSRSMLAQDVSPDRLGRAVSLARRLVHDLDGNRFALVGFSGHPFLLSPLTLDASAITLQLDALDPDMASVGGSGLAAAVDLARRTLTATRQGGDRAIVVLSDGESFEGSAALESAGRALSRAGITLVAIPVGTLQGARIPEPGGGWHRDAEGQIVTTVRRDDLLQALTAGANGVLVSGNAADPVGDARQALAHLNRSRTRDRTTEDLIPRAWIFALVAALILLAHTLTRRSAALASVLLVLGVHAARAQRPSSGTRLLAHGDTAAARRAFLAEARSHQSDTSWYNAGTSALVARDFAAAEDQLSRATLSIDPALRERALVSLGTAFLMQARKDSAQRDTLLASAAARLREALMLAPGDRTAKFNYELARRLRPPPPPSSSPGKGKGNQRPSQAPPPRSQGGNGMTQAEADQVLDAMERAERETRQTQNERARRGEPTRGPDW